MKKEEFIEMIKRGEPTYKIIYTGATNYPNDLYNSFWALLGCGDKFYYVEYNILHKESDLEVTLYNKINPYTKRQAGYPKNINNLNELLNYIHITKNEKNENLKDTYNQELFYQLSIYTEKRNNCPYTIQRQLEEMAGYREDYILNNLNWIYEEENNNNYHVLVFEDKEGNYFKINTKDRKRLIVG